MEIVIWLIFCGVVACFASQRGKNPLLWFLSAMVASPLIVGVVLAMSKDESVEKEINEVKMDTQQLKERVAVGEANTNARFEQVGARLSSLQSNVDGILNTGITQQPGLLTESTRFNGVNNDMQQMLNAHRQQFINQNMQYSGTQVKSNNGYKQCPYCGETIRESAIKCRFCGSNLENVKMVECPYCKELIREYAPKCQYCGTDLVWS